MKYNNNSLKSDENENDLKDLKMKELLLLMLWRKEYISMCDGR